MRHVRQRDRGRAWFQTLYEWDSASSEWFDSMPSREMLLRDQADLLVKGSHLIVIDLPLDLADRFPSIAQLVKQTNLDDWDFFGTVAGVGAGVVEAPVVLSRDEAELALRLAGDALNQWNGQGLDALRDLMTFVRKRTEAGLDIETAIGGWLLWNVKGQKPSSEEFDVAPVIGSFLRAAAASCWR